MVGTNGGGPLNTNSAHPFENPDGLTNLLEIYALLPIGFALPFAYGRLVKDAPSGLGAVGGHAGPLAEPPVLATSPRDRREPARGGARRDAAGGNMEGKESASARPPRDSSPVSPPAPRPARSTACPRLHDPARRASAGEMLLGEVSPGGVGAGLYGMLVYALLAVFIAGLMVGRTPEYLGKKMQAHEMNLVVLYILSLPAVWLGFAAADGAARTGAGVTGIGTRGPERPDRDGVRLHLGHGNNNGSAFGGLSANTDWFNTTLGAVDARWPVLPHRPGAGRRRVAGPPSRGCRPPPARSPPAHRCSARAAGGRSADRGRSGGASLPVVALGPVVEHLGS